MRAGILRDRVKVQKFTDQPDALGAPERQWQDVAEAQAQIMEQGKSSEFFAAGTEVAEGTVRIRMRELPGLAFDPAWRLVDIDRGDIYEITSIVPSRVRNDLTVMARHGGVKR